MKIETVTIKNGASGRLVINRSDYDPKKHELWESPEISDGDIVTIADDSQERVLEDRSPESSVIFTEDEISEKTYRELKEKAAFAGVSAGNKGALVKKLRSEGLVG